MASVALTATKFAETVESNEVVLVDFWANGSGPRRMFGYVFEAPFLTKLGQVNGLDMNEARRRIDVPTSEEASRATA